MDYPALTFIRENIMQENLNQSNNELITKNQHLLFTQSPEKEKPMEAPPPPPEQQPVMVAPPPPPEQNTEREAPLQPLPDNEPEERLKSKVEGILKESQENPGIPFETENLETLAKLEKEDKATYERIRDVLKKSGVRIKELDIKINEQRQKLDSDENEDRLCPYTIEKDRFVYHKHTAQGYSTVTLCNFIALIEEQIERDDGLEVKILYKVSGKTDTGQILPPVEIPAKAFNSMHWVADHYGAYAIINVGNNNNQHIRAAIQQLSNGAMISSKEHSHTGLKKIDGEYYFLTSAGALGKDGINPNVKVNMTCEGLSVFNLKGVNEDADIKDVIKTSLNLLEMGPKHIMYPLLCMIYCAPLSDIILNNFSVFLSGKSGEFKTEAAIIVQSHYGKDFSAENLPGYWRSTTNSLEKKAFICKDVVMVIDDFAPKRTMAEANFANQKADDILRGQGNKAGRDRMRSDSSIQQGYYPRGVILSTGEYAPSGQSLRGRMLILELSPNDIKSDILTDMQGYAASGTPAMAMGEYIKYILSQIDNLKSTLSDRKSELRRLAINAGKPHNRTPDIVACLMIGLEMFLNFAKEKDAITDDQYNELYNEGWNSLCFAANSQDSLQVTEDPVQRFIDLMNAAFTMGLAHLEDINGGKPKENGENYGWKVTTIEGDNTQQTINRPQGNMIGWIEKDNIYFDPDATFTVLQVVGRRQGAPFTIPQRNLFKHVDEKGLILSKEKGRFTTRKIINGNRKAIIHIHKDSLR